MSTDLITADVKEDQEVVAKLIEEYDVMALPVVDENGELKGIITYDDVIDIIKEEQTEDVERMMAISGEVEDRDYLDVPVFIHFKKRIPWIIILFFLGIVSSKVIGHYEEVLSQVVILAFFFPLLNGTGGNTGAQSASMVLRSLTLDTLEDSDFVKAFFKEFLVSLLVGTVLFTIMYISFYVFGFHDANFPVWKISLAVSLAMAFQVISATLIGASLPMIAAKFKLDPAVVAMPAITTIVDFTGLIIYFNVAKVILGL
jgi:magnesium transporter